MLNKFKLILLLNTIICLPSFSTELVFQSSSRLTSSYKRKLYSVIPRINLVVQSMAHNGDERGEYIGIRHKNNDELLIQINESKQLHFIYKGPQAENGNKIIMKYPNGKYIEQNVGFGSSDKCKESNGEFLCHFTFIIWEYEDLPEGTYSYIVMLKNGRRLIHKTKIKTKMGNSNIGW
jgi:hypothetical protein